MTYAEIPILPYPSEQKDDFIKRVFDENFLHCTDLHTSIRLESGEGGSLQAFARVPIRQILVDPHLAR